MPNDADGGSGRSFSARGAGTAPTRNVVEERLRSAKRSAIEQAMGKADTWCAKVIGNESGILLDDLPQLLSALHLKVVDSSTVAVDPAIARAYEDIARKSINRGSLLLGDDE